MCSNRAPFRRSKKVASKRGNQKNDLIQATISKNSAFPSTKEGNIWLGVIKNRLLVNNLILRYPLCWKNFLSAKKRKCLIGVIKSRSRVYKKTIRIRTETFVRPQKVTSDWGNRKRITCIQPDKVQEHRNFLSSQEGNIRKDNSKMDFL